MAGDIYIFMVDSRCWSRRQQRRQEWAPDRGHGAVGCSVGWEAPSSRFVWEPETRLESWGLAAG